MKFKVGDKVQIVSDKSKTYEQYIGYFAIIVSIDEIRVSKYLYELDILGFKGETIARDILWEEEGLQLVTDELIETMHKEADENLQKFLKIDNVIIKSAKHAGITKEQAYKFMDGFRLFGKEGK